MKIKAVRNRRVQTTAVAGPPQSPQPAQRVTKQMLHVAKKLIGIELTDAQAETALGSVNRSLGRYETLRKISVPLDTPLATSFHPALPGMKLQGRSGAVQRGTSKPGKVALPKFSNVEELAFCSATQLAELVRTQRVSSIDLTGMYLARLKRYAPKLNCVVTLTEELALRQAAAADRAIKRGKYRGPLHGIPWGVKDLFATRDIPTTWGAEPYRDQMIDYDATVIERLREAGAVLVAKLSLGALAGGGSRWFGGVTRNPWHIEDDKIGASGSSGGSACAAAAGLVGFTLGSETFGSIAFPAARCGVVGLRPTYGRVSRHGAMALSWTLDKVGAICRSAEDCALVLDTIYGSDGKDETVEDLPFNWTSKTDISKLKIGYLKREFDLQPAAQKKVYNLALRALRVAGANLAPIELPRIAWQGLTIIHSVEAAPAFDDLTRSSGIDTLTDEYLPSRQRAARFIPAVEYLRAQRVRVLLMRDMELLMSEWDAFVAPAPDSASIFITNLTGHPQVAIPCGFIGKLPQSIVITGKLFDEVAPLRIALAFERATKWHAMYPQLD